MYNNILTYLLSRSKSQYCWAILIAQVVFLTFIAFSRQQVNINVITKVPLTSVVKTHRRYNLMEERATTDQVFNMFFGDKCTLDYMNANKLPQDHPCVIETIRKKYLKEPSPANVPLKLDADNMNERSPGQANVIRQLLKNQTNGFFVESGAYDGEYLSNTLTFEREFGWTGLLIEANPPIFEKLISRNRKAWTLPACISLDPFPTKVNFQPIKENFAISHIEGGTNQQPGTEGLIAQCFPFYSMLLAVGKTDVDFFSLDVEGHELKILQTIPWHKVNIKSLTVEWDHILEGQDALVKFMEESGFIKIGAFAFPNTRDIIFIQDYINGNKI